MGPGIRVDTGKSADREPVGAAAAAAEAAPEPATA
jgi:hypothetical protein